MYEKSVEILGLPFYKYLTQEQKDIVINNSEIKRYKKGEEICGLVKHCVGPFLILEGSVRAIIDDENFREISLFELRAKEMGLLSAACVLEHITFDAKFVVDTDSILLTVKPCVIKKIMQENIEVRCVIFETLVDRFSLCMTTLHNLLFTRYERRMAAFLVERYIYTGEMEFNITQEEIAKLTSSAREVAGKTIRQFAKDGIVEYGRGKIKIIDIKRLKEIM